MEKPTTMDAKQAAELLSEIVGQANGLIEQAKKIAQEYGLEFEVADGNAVFEGDSHYNDGRWVPDNDFRVWMSSSC